METAKQIGIKALLPFWIFVVLFKFGAGLHYSLLSSLGTRVLPIWVVGILVGTGAFFQLIFDVPAGYLLDRFGYVRLLRIATFVFMLAAFSLLFGLSLVTFTITLALSTLGWLFMGPGSNAYMLSHAPKAVAGKYMGFYHTMSSGGVVLATIVLTLVVTRSAQFIGIVIGGLLFCAWIAILLVSRESNSVHTEKKLTHHHYYIRRHFLSHLFKVVKQLNPASSILMLQSFSGCLFYGVIWFTVPLILAGGSHSGLLGVSLSVFDLAVVILGTFLGKLADRIQSKKLVFLGLLTFATTGTLLGFNLNLWFLLLGFLATAGDEMSAVSLWAWLDRLDKKHNEDGLISGAVIMFEDLGWTIGPIFAGIVFNYFGPSWAITLAALPIFVVWLISLFLKDKSAHPITNRFALEYPRRHHHKR